MQGIDDINPVLQQLVSLASGIPINRTILADQGRAPPSGTDTYATYLLVPVRAYGQVRRERIALPATVDTTINDWLDWSETVITSMEVMLSVNLLNRGANDAALRLHNANFRAPMREYLFLNRIGWRYVSDARNITAIQNAGLQQRYQADIQLFIETSVSYDVLRPAGFELVIRDEDGNTPYGAH